MSIWDHLDFSFLKVQQNMKEVIKGFRLYDYNRDGNIQKKELRAVLENYCTKMNDQQFDK